MPYTASHWGAYTFEESGPLVPLATDPMPSRIGRGWASAAQDKTSRILAPCVRKGWLEGDKGAARNGDSFVELSWDEAFDLTASELTRVRVAQGNGAIFGGSYGWASAGRFHHAQSQLRRFLNCIGGYVGSRDTYSHAAAEVLFPHVLGLSQRAVQDNITSIDEVADHCELLLSFGGISTRTAQITSSGTSRHEVGDWIDRLRAAGTRIVLVSPMGTDTPGAEWLSIRPGTDTALMLALCHEVLVTERADLAFLNRYTSGWPEFRDYLLGQSGGEIKGADWAATICDIPAGTIRALAGDLSQKRSMISVAWALQRAEHGEQPIWAALALAAMLGQIGRPGVGYAFGYGSTTPVGRSTRLIPWPSLPQGRNPVDDFIPVARVADMLLQPGGLYRYDCTDRHYPDIRLVYWVGGNPFHHHQDLRRLERAWQRPETVIVHDHSWTATARRADIVLPATTPLERHDYMANRRDPALIYMSPYMLPMGQARDDYAIFQGLAQRMGVWDAFTEGRSAEDWLRVLWAQSQEVARAHGFDLPSFAEIKETGRFDVPDAQEHRRLLANFVADPDAHPLATESGRITIFNKGLADADLKGCTGHPSWMEPDEAASKAAQGALHLISGQPDTRLHAQNDRGSESLASKIAGREPADLHPDTAAAHGLAAGDVARLHNDLGACLVGIRIKTAMRRDCISLATGAWYDPQMVGGTFLEVHGNPNVLVRDKGCSELSQGNIAHSAMVWIEKWDGPLPDLTVSKPPKIEAPRSGGDA
jgi:biotin/methionine sulfoxide reductase